MGRLVTASIAVIGGGVGGWLWAKVIVDSGCKARDLGGVGPSIISILASRSSIGLICIRWVMGMSDGGMYP